MRFSKKLFVIFVGVIIQVTTDSAQGDTTPPQSIQQSLEKFFYDEAEALRGYPPDSVYSPKIDASYSSLLAGKATKMSVAALPNAVLEDFFRAASEVAFYTFSDRSVDDLVLVANELERRAMLSRVQALDVFKALFSVRRIKDAARWREEHVKSFPAALPRFVEASQLAKTGATTELIVPAESDTVERRLVDLTKGSLILVVAHPQCHFSQNAIAQITADQILRSRWQGHVKWVAPQSRNYDIDVVRDWNRQHPEAQISLAYKASEWTAVDSWETPIFYFFHDGRMVKKIVGWPQGGRMADLYEASRLIGIDGGAEEK